jgi:hypothetical protein
VAFSLLLYQKKPAVVTILIATSSWLLAHPRESSRLARRILAGGVVAMAVIYFTAVIVPISARADTETGVPREVDDLALYAALAPLTRTAGAAVYYPTVFPEQHEFYGLDLGQDLLGFGEFPDDNLVVYDAMYPGGRGTAAAPFQFVLYSQVGLVGGLLGSAAVGAILALLWRIGRASAWPRAYASLFGALTILLAVYYAMESLRNGVLVSYGVLWGYLFVLLLAGLTAAAARIRAGGSRLRVPWLDGPNADEPAESRPGQVRKTADDAPVVGRHETT